MSYTLDAGYLGSAFGRADHAAMERVRDALVARLLAARSYRIAAPGGTDLTGRIAPGGAAPAMTDFAVALFPVMIFPPVTCDALEGTLAIERFVTSTSTRAYEGSVLPVPETVLATVKDSRITALDGPAGLTAALDAQMTRAAALTGGDPRRINSWHTGINPFTYYHGRAADDPERWGTIAYGSPRYTHFHAAGRDPGDLAFHLMDATICVDGEPLWQDGRFTFLDRPEIRALAPDLPGSAHRLPIGL
jgi:hypothetical protein